MKKLLILLTISAVSHGQDINDKLKNYGIPSHIQTGFSSPSEMNREFSGRPKVEGGIDMIQLAQENGISVTPTIEEDAVGRIKHILPPTISKYIPAHYILMAQLSRQDSPYFQAFKLEKLGLIIKDIPLTHLSPEAQRYKKTLMAHCFLYAGRKLESALDQQIQVNRNQIAPELLMDGYMSAGQFYYWAAVNMNPQAAALVQTFAIRAFGKTQQAIQNIPIENYTWEVIGETQLREVIHNNQLKIEDYLTSNKMRV